MKKLLLLPLAGMLALGAAAAVPFSKQHSRVPVAREAVTPEVLIHEAFNAFAAGSETAPGDPIEYENSYHIPDSLTVQPGWTGGGLRPAGGCVAIEGYTDSYGDPRNGYISTPHFLLSGTATITFKARAGAGSSTAKLWVALCDDTYGPGEDQLDANLTTSWKQLRIVARNASLELPSYFQFMAEEGCVLIDNVHMDFVPDRIATPEVLPAGNNSETEFTARWSAVNGAEAYRLNVLCTKPVENPVSGEVVMNFDDININGTAIDAANPNYPEGWTISVSENGSADVAGASNLSSAPVAIKFDAEGDMIESAELPYPLDDLSFWVKPSSMKDETEFMSLLRVELYHSTSGSWEAIAHIPCNWMNASGGRYSFIPEALGNDVTRVRISMIQHGKVDFYIDDMTLHYTQRGDVSKHIDNLDVAATEYKVSDIDPANEYSYYVQAVKGSVVSEMSYVVWVDGITGLKVTTNEPENVYNSGFTALWNPLGHATDYKVELYRLFTPKEDAADVVVLSENFNGITEGTVDNPGTDYNSPFDFGVKGWAATGWGATQPAWAKGMAGTTGTNPWVGNAGLVFTPNLDLSCHDGSGIKVNATVVTTTDTFEYGDVSEKEGVFALIMRSPTDTEVIASGYLDTPELGSNSGTMTIANIPADADLSGVVIAFMNKSGLPFFVDEVEITMNVPAGKTLMAPVSLASTSETSCAFSGLDPMSDHAYAVTASASHNFENYVSIPSDIRVVKTSEASISDVTLPQGAMVIAGRGTITTAAAAEVYTPAGALVARAAAAATLKVAPGIYIVKTAGGTAVKVVVR